MRVEAQGLPTLTLGDSDAMRPGDPVVAIGNPLGLEDTVSNGLVSARRKGKRKGKGGDEVLQVSAPIAPGSSGGPLFNDRGEVVGVSQAVMQGGQNLAFGVPIRYLASLQDPVAQAWAMRDVFDGLLDVVVWRQDGTPQPQDGPSGKSDE